MKKYKENVKDYVFSLYGNKCANCGFNDKRALQLDHKNGCKEKQGDYERGGIGLYYAIYLGRRNKDDFQLLCANCNWIKRHTNKEHRPTIKSGVQYIDPDKKSVYEVIRNSGVNKTVALKMLGIDPLLKR